MSTFQVYLVIQERERAEVAKSLRDYYAVTCLDIEQFEGDIAALITAKDIVVVDMSCSSSEQYIKTIRSKTSNVGVVILARRNEDIELLDNGLYDTVIFFPISQEELLGNIKRLRAKLRKS